MVRRGCTAGTRMSISFLRHVRLPHEIGAVGVPASGDEDVRLGDLVPKRRPATRWFWIVSGACAVAALATVAILVRGPSGPQLPAGSGSLARVRLMTGAQYANTIHYIFGPNIDVGSAFAPLVRTQGLLEVTTSSASVSLGQMEDFQLAATSIAAQVMKAGDVDRGIPSSRDTLVPCKPESVAGPDDECAATFIRRVGRLLFRRPLDQDEVTKWVGRAHRAASNLHDFYAGLQTVLEGMLIDPKFLLIQDTTELDPTRPGQRRLDSYALASRLSFLLWNSVPDDQLLKAAESGELQTNSGRRREVERMLASPQLDSGVRAFFDDMFGFADFDSLSKDPNVYPEATEAALRAAREQTLLTVVDFVVRKNADYRDLFTTRSTFISPALAPIYGAVAPSGWTPYRFPADSKRAGLLTQVSFLALHSQPVRSSATLRGKALRELFLCETIPPPPNNVDFSAVDNPPPSLVTARQQLTFHRKNPSCAGCHKLMDPIGLGLEQFDGAGKVRATEGGEPIDVSGELDGKTFVTAAGLGLALRNDPALPTCLVKRLYSYAAGGAIKPSDPTFAYFDAKFQQSGYHVVALLRDIAMSKAFSRIEAPAASRKALLTSAN